MDSGKKLDINTAEANVAKTKKMEGSSAELESTSESMASRAHSIKIKMTPWKTLRKAILAAQQKCVEDNNPVTFRAYRDAIDDGYEHWNNQKSIKLKYQVIDPKKDSPLTFLEQHDTEIAALSKKTRKTVGFTSAVGDKKDEEIVDPPILFSSSRKNSASEKYALVATVDSSINEERPAPKPAKRGGWMQFFSDCCCSSKDEPEEEQADEPTYNTMQP
jgi:hypothetical protein